MTSPRVVLQHLLNLIENKTVGIRSKATLTYLLILNGQELAKQWQRDLLLFQVGQQIGISLIYSLLRPVVTNTIRIAVTSS
ncbi:hypothetical protein D3C84_924860 [compost metagenome]